MSQRFYSATPIEGDHARLDDAEAHHLVHVMRAKAGDRITLFDGSGCEFTARIERIGRSTVDLAIADRSEIDRELPFELTLAVALPKGDRQKWLVEKAVELGVTAVVPLVTARSVADPSGRSKLDRAVIEASKQCGRNRLMRIETAQRWSDLVAVDANANAIRFFAHTGVSANRFDESVYPSKGIIVAVGPEGGWTDDEARLAGQHGWQAVSLGPRILRVETAAIALAALASQMRLESLKERRVP